MFQILIKRNLKPLIEKTKAKKSKKNKSKEKQNDASLQTKTC